MNAARETTRVAEGRMSYFKVRAMTRIVTRENEDYLLMIAEHDTAAHVEALVRASRTVTAKMACDRANAQHANRALEWWSENGGSMVIRVRVCVEDGARLVKAIERERLRAERPAVGVSAEMRESEPVEALRADALLAAVTGQPGTELQAHVSAETLCDDTMHGECRLVDGPSIVHWAHGGETALENLVQLCSHHHRLVHEGGFDVSRRVDGTLHFTDRDGEPLVETPPLVHVDPDHALPLPATYPLTSDDTRMDLAMAVEGVLCASGVPLNA